MHKISWTPYVFLRYVIFLILGIVFEIHISSSTSIWICLNISSLAIYLIAYAVSTKHQKYLFQDLFGVLAFLFLFSTGGLITHFQNERNNKDHILNLDRKILWYTGQIASEVQNKENWFKAELEIDQIKTKKGWENASGRVLIYQPKKDSLRKFEYGDVLIIKGSPFEVRHPDNPYDFNYKKYQSFKQIFHQHFLKKEYSIIKKNQGNKIIAFSLFLRKKGEALFKKNIKGQNESSLASALILGIKHDLDSELKTAYSRIGVIHVLAVSGMHVALIFKMLLLGFGRIKRIKKGHVIFGLFSLSLIWLFAFVTGLSASVLRAVVMFSFLVMGEMFQQQKNTYNNLSLSAFCLLVYDPFLIMDIGFQLSYLAVFGIVYLYPKIYGWFEFENWELDFFWKTIAITIAAQIATSPLSIFYFQQFPTYFLFSNLIIIPLTSAILYVGVSLLFFGQFPFLPDLLGLIIKGMVWLCNKVVFFTNDLPLASITGLVINPLETFLLYIIIGLALALFYSKSFKYVWAMLIVVSIFSVSQIKRTVTLSNTRYILVYKSNKSSEVELFAAGNHILVKDSTDEALGLKESNGFKFLSWKGKTLLLIDKSLEKFQYKEKEKIPIDLLIVRNNSIGDFKEISKIFKVNQIVIDGSNSKKVSGRLLKSASSLNLTIHSIEESGVFELKF
ncbi:MAG TPA: ComEC/Rec2 family competence protein [Cytophagales bacterium]|nr:ComEC/Rec2 family competence protein [Cytophagales bacterium]